MTTTEIFEKFSAIDDGPRLLRLSLEDHMHAIESAKMGIVDSLRWMAEIWLLGVLGNTPQSSHGGPTKEKK